MSKNRMVNTRFWSDNFIVEKLNALDRLLFLYLLTNNKTNILGIYELPLRTAAFETGIDKDDLEKMLKRLSPKVEYLDNGWVYIRRFADHQQLNPNIEKGMMREVFALPDNVIKNVLKCGIESPRLSKAFESLSKHFKESEEPELKLKPKLEPKPKLKKATNVASRTAKPPIKKVKTTEIDRLFALWSDVVGYDLTSQVKANREYAARLLREYDLEAIEKMLSGVAMSHADQYAPRISNFKQLYLKWDDLKAWGRRTMNKQSGSGKVVKI